VASVDLQVRIIPWIDSDFVHAVERARDQAVAEGLTIYGPRAAARVEQLLRAEGYPDAQVECARTPEEALRRAARWTVIRDGRSAPR